MPEQQARRHYVFEPIHTSNDKTRRMVGDGPLVQYAARTENGKTYAPHSMKRSQAMAQTFALAYGCKATVVRTQDGLRVNVMRPGGLNEFGNALDALTGRPFRSIAIDSCSGEGPEQNRREPEMKNVFMVVVWKLGKMRFAGNKKERLSTISQNGSPVRWVEAESEQDARDDTIAKMGAKFKVGEMEVVVAAPFA